MKSKFLFNLYSKKVPKIIGGIFIIGTIMLLNLIPFISYHEVLAASDTTLSISNLGRNITKGETNWQKNVSLEPNDEIEFSIRVDAKGTGTATNVLVINNLPLSLNYVAGSTNGATTYDITSGWQSIGNLSAGTYKMIYFKARASDSSRFSAGSNILTNRARAIFGTSSWPVADKVTVIVNKEGVSEQKPSEQNPSPALYISKTGRNITKHGNTWAEKIQAEPGDEIEFFIEITSTGNRPAEDVYVRDYLPSKLKYVDYSTHGVTQNNITDGWYNISDIIVGTTKTIYFKAKIAEAKSFGTGSTTLTNTLKVYADSVKTISDKTEIIVTKGQVLGSSTTATTSSDGELIMGISKLVRNISAGQIGFRESTSVKTEEIIEFSINIVNSGYAPVEKIKIWDILPSGLNYIDDSCYLDNVKVGDGIAGAGLIIDALAVRGNKTIKFQAKVASADNFNNRTTDLTNYVYANAKGISDISDKASITITAEKGNATATESGGKILGATSIPTGPIEILDLSLIISLLISAAIYFIIKHEEKIKAMVSYLKLKFVIVKLRFQEKYL